MNVLKSTKKKIVAIALASSVLVCSLTGCASLNRLVTDVKSDMSGGLQRTITVYTADGNVIAEYTGKIDIETNDGGYVKFDYNGKRYIYYNCFIETIADIN